MDGIKYFLLNKKKDYVAQGRYLCSGWLDSGEKQTEWSRICIRSEETGKESWHIQVFVSEQERIFRRGRQQSICEIIEAQDISMEEKLALYAPYRVRAMEGSMDFLLEQVVGRYIWLVVEKDASQDTGAELPEIQIFFDSRSWMAYLPEIYARQSEDGFLFRYLSIFQWIYQDMSTRISELPHMLYPAFAGSEELEWLAAWFDLENQAVWNQSQLVYLLENGNRLHNIRGTKGYMEEIVRLFTGYTPYIVEHYQAEAYKTDMRKARLLEELYGENAYVVTVLLPGEAVEDRQKAAVVKQLLRSSVPADVECRLVVLEPYIFLDRHTYVGINSQLGGSREAALNGDSLTPYVSMVGKRLERRADL